MAYVLGFIFADGTVEDCRESSRTCYLQLTNNDHALLDEIKKTMSSNHSLYFRPQKYNKFRNGSYQCKATYNLRIGSKLIYEDLSMYGLTPRKSLKIRLPQVPDDLFGFFLRGYFDGDGCVNVYKKTPDGLAIQVVFTCGSKLFLCELSNIISKLADVKNKNIFSQSYAFRLRYVAEEAVSVLDLIYRDLNKSPYLRKKFNIYSEYQASKCQIYR